MNEMVFLTSLGGRTTKKIRWTGLRKISRKALSLQTEFLHLSDGIVLTVGLKELTIHFSETIPRLRRWASLEVWVGDAAYDVSVGGDLIRGLLEAHGFQQDIWDLSPQTRAIVIEHLLQDNLKIFEAATNTTVAFIEMHETSGQPDPSAAALTVSGATNATSAVAIDGDLDLLAQSLRGLSQSTTQFSTPLIDKLSWLASFRGQDFRISKTELDALEVEHGFLLPSGWTPKVIKKLVIGNKFEITIAQIEEGLSPVSDLSDIKLKTLEDHIVIQPNDIEVEISIELARDRFHVDQISDVANGNILPFTQKVGTQVRLYCNEKPVADGELVELNGNFAVQITDLV